MSAFKECGSVKWYSVNIFFTGNRFPVKIVVVSVSIPLSAFV
jgi:hypothetical protein